MNGKGECVDCHKSCKTCEGTDAKDCKSCDEKTRETVSNGECKCKEGFFEKDPIEADCA